MAPKITAVKRAMLLFSRKYGRASYRDIGNKCAISKSSSARICLQVCTKKKLVKRVTDKTSTKLTSWRGDQEKSYQCTKPTVDIARHANQKFSHNRKKHGRTEWTVA